MQINPAYLPQRSEQDRSAAMAEAALLLQEVDLLAAAVKAGVSHSGTSRIAHTRQPRDGRY